jgi:hypothetical protein
MEVQYWWDVLRGVCASPPIKPVTLNASQEKRKKRLAEIARPGRVAISHCGTQHMFSTSYLASMLLERVGQWYMLTF